MYRLEKPDLVVGRSSKSDIWLDEPSVSRQHARLTRSELDIGLIDLDSKNGTFCNGKPVHETTMLKDGDKIQIGAETVLKFSMQDELDEAAQEKLYAAAVRDGVTGVFNESFVCELLKNELAYAARHDQPVSILRLDIDQFDALCQTHGPSAGSFVLLNVANQVTQAVRAEDVLGRFNTSELVLVMRGVSEEVAVAVAGRMRRHIAETTFQFNFQPLRVTVSIGVATQRHNEFKSGEDLLEASRSYMEKAKKNGRNRVESKFLAIDE